MLFHRNVLFLLLLHFIPTFALINRIVGCNVLDTAAINAAIDEAITVAKDARQKLDTFNPNSNTQSFIEAAYRPLFDPGDIDKLKDLYQQIGDIRTSTTYSVSFYCNQDHIKDIGGNWVDEDFTYRDPNGQIKNIGLRIGKTTPSKPGVRGSFTISGHVKAPDIDFSGQNHIYISQLRRSVNPSYDQRPFATVVRDGFQPNRSYLDGMKPLSETVFHELVHVVGGTIRPDSSIKNIRDGPAGKPGVNGFRRCVQLHLGTGGKTIDTADCIFVLAKALFLQINNIQNHPTFWSTGKVDPATLKPVAVPSTSTPQPPPPKRDMPQAPEEPRYRYQRRNFRFGYI